MRVLGIKPGAVSPFALINDSACSVKVLLDQEMMTLRPLNYHPLSNDMTIAVSLRVWPGSSRPVGMCRKSSTFRTSVQKRDPDRIDSPALGLCGQFSPSEGNEMNTILGADGFRLRARLPQPI